MKVIKPPSNSPAESDSESSPHRKERKSGSFADWIGLQGKKTRSNPNLSDSTEKKRRSLKFNNSKKKMSARPVSMDLSEDTKISKLSFSSDNVPQQGEISTSNTRKYRKQLMQTYSLPYGSELAVRLANRTTMSSSHEGSSESVNTEALININRGRTNEQQGALSSSDSKESSPAPLSRSILSPELAANLVFESSEPSTPPSTVSTPKLKRSSTNFKESSANIQPASPSLVGASVQALLAFIIEDLVVDQKNEQLKYFLLAYRQFTPPLDLLMAILEIFNDAAKKEDQDRLRIQMRVVKLLCRWFSINFHDFQDTMIQDMVNQFLLRLQNLGNVEQGWAGIVSKTWQKAAADLVEKSTRTSRANKSKNLVFEPLSSRKLADLQKNYSRLMKSDYQSLSILDFTPEELARQLTAKDHALFSSVPVDEFLRCNFTKGATSPKLEAMKDQFNIISKWICTEVCTVPNIKTRVKTLSHCINLADRLRKLQNWHSLMAVVSGLALFPCSQQHHQN
eukprot:TRINITY_DN1394_c0_g1_i2.p1 TRINITY_DN1394_c0_g1~~TRINITY_DN1394_c0_g1_i2.p1  ORF type:complete len:510 (-),score=80.68 TRINITY_DN1394_c0_g1_i2:677-2206(-)